MYHTETTENDHMTSILHSILTSASFGFNDLSTSSPRDRWVFVVVYELCFCFGVFF